MTRPPRARSFSLFALASTVACGCGGGTPAPVDGGPLDSGSPDARTHDGGSDAGRASVWDCVGLTEWPTPLGATATFELTFWEVVGTDVTGPLAGATAEACPAGDSTCGAPIASDTTDASGRAAFTVPTDPLGWDGFIRVTSSSSVPTYLFLHPPVWYDGARWGGPWALADAADLEALARHAIDPTRGSVLVLTADCCYLARGAVAGCETSDTSELEVTLGGAAPDSHTPGDYAYLFFDVLPGPVTLQARHAGALVGSVDLLVVAGAFTETVIGPTPLP